MKDAFVRTEIVDIIGYDPGEAKMLAEFDGARIEQALLLRQAGLQFDKEMSFAKPLLTFGNKRKAPLHISGKRELGKFSAQAGGACDQVTGIR